MKNFETIGPLAMAILVGLILPTMAFAKDGVRAPTPPLAEEVPERLTRSMVQNVMRGADPDVEDCSQNSNPDGYSAIVVIRFEVNGSGFVTSAEAQDPAQGLAVAQCLEDVVRNLRFPKTRDESRLLHYPFRVRHAQ